MEPIIGIDPLSLLAGVSLTSVTGWLASFLALRKNEKNIHIEQITKERGKWRSDMRTLAKDICILYSKTSQEICQEEIASVRATLSTSLNPKCQKDNLIIEQFDKLSANDADLLHIFEKHVALLLKHDWERVKWECTAIYLKPFVRFTTQSRAWRKSNNR